MKPLVPGSRHRAPVEMEQRWETFCVLWQSARSPEGLSSAGIVLQEVQGKTQLFIKRCKPCNKAGV